MCSVSVDAGQGMCSVSVRSGPNWNLVLGGDGWVVAGWEIDCFVVAFNQVTLSCSTFRLPNF